MMPHCLVYAAPRVRQFFLAAKVVTALDIACWWVERSEVEEHAASSGWDGIELQSALMVWAEANRPAARSHPDVPVPQQGPAPALPPVLAPAQGPTHISADRLRVVPPPLPPSAERHRHALEDIFMAAGQLCVHWTAGDRQEVFDLIARKPLRTAHKTVNKCPSAWRR